MKILITGAGGYIGSVSTAVFLDKGYDVIAIDNFSRGYKGPLLHLQKKYGKDRLTFYERDLEDLSTSLGTSPLDDIFESHPDIQAVAHYAALCLVNESMEQPGLYFKNNVYAGITILEAMCKYKIPSIVFSSTCATYGNAQYVPIDEQHPTNPENPYGESKRIVEKMIEWYSRLKGINYVVLRYFNVCGATDDGEVGDSKRPSVLLMQNAVRGALGIEPFALTCPKVDTPDGTPIRDYINVVDLNLAHVKAVEYLSKGGESTTINLGTGTGSSVMEIINKVQEVTGKKFDLQTSEPRKGESAKLIAKIDKAQTVLGWSPEHSIEDSVRSLVKWYGNHPHGWDS